MKQLLVTFEVMLPDAATDEDADALVKRMEELVVAPNAMEAFANFPVRPVGKLSDWLFEH